VASTNRTSPTATAIVTAALTSLELAAQIPRKLPSPKGGRPTKLDATRVTRLVTAIREGNYAMTACKLAGVSYDAYNEWMRLGDTQHSGQYFLFRQAIDAAEAEAEAEAVSRVLAAGEKDWKATSTWLGRRHRDRWAEQLSDSGNSGAKVVLNIGIALPGTGAQQPQLVEAQTLTVIPRLGEK
jgi:anti-sigma28 factor (negative regulator of flagellin synthesis)